MTQQDTLGSHQRMFIMTSALEVLCDLAGIFEVSESHCLVRVLHTTDSKNFYASDLFIQASEESEEAL